MKSEKKIGVILSYIIQAVRILTGLIYTPIMLRLLGQSEYGLYQLVNSVVSYLSLLSLGFTSSYIRFHSREKAEGGKSAVDRINGMFLTIFLAISMICILCGFVMIINIHGIFSEGLTSDEYATATILMVLMIFNLAISFPASLFDSYITAHECFVFQKLVGLVHSLMNPFLTLPILLMGFGSVGMVVTSTCMTIVFLVINIYYCFVKLEMNFCFKNFRWGLLKELWIFTFWIFVSQIVDQINWSVDKFLLGRFRGTESVAIYGIGGQISTLYNSFSSAVSNVFVPQVNNICCDIS